MSLTLIMPCGGKSSRFVNSRPKWALTAPNGNLMLIEALNGLDLKNVERLIITFVKEHIDNHNVNLEKISNKIQKLKNIKPEFVVLDNFTKSQSETICLTIKEKQVKGSFCIKDCDNAFNTTLTTGNTVHYSTLQNGINAINKGYIAVDKLGNLSGIIEKTVIGNKFCAGVYSFENAEYFCQVFETLSKMKSIELKELYTSHIIQQMLIEGQTFDIQEVENYLDWGTLEDWEKYTSEFKTLFVDIDGCLVINSSEYFQPVWGEAEGLTNNIKILNDLYNSNKGMIILTTARSEEYREATIQQLERLGIFYHQIIFGLLHAPRVLINDYSTNSNKYPTSISINLKRNQDNLQDFLKGQS